MELVVYVVLKMDNLFDIFWYGELIIFFFESLFIFRFLCICLYLCLVCEVEICCII